MLVHGRTVSDVYMIIAINCYVTIAARARAAPPRDGVLTRATRIYNLYIAYRNLRLS